MTRADQREPGLDRREHNPAVLRHDCELWRLSRVQSIFGGTAEIMKEIITSASASSLTRSSTKKVLSVPNTMSDRTLDVAACGLSVAGSGGPWRLLGQK